MSFRDDHDAALARADALEKELTEQRERTTDAENELQATRARTKILEHELASRSPDDAHATAEANTDVAKGRWPSWGRVPAVTTENQARPTGRNNLVLLLVLSLALLAMLAKLVW